MAESFLREYGTATTINFELADDPNPEDLQVAATFATGDVKIMKDEGVEANTTNLPTDEGTGYSLALTATEMQAARIMIYLIDQTATKVWMDKAIRIETYGNASAQHAVNLNDSVRAGLTALPNAAAEAAGGLYTRGTGAGQINQAANGQVDANAVAISGGSTAADNAQIVFETDFATNYNATRNAWATNVQDFVGTTAADPFNGQVISASVTGAVGSVSGNVDGNVTGSVGSNLELGPAEVNTEVSDVLKTDTIAELTADPGATPTFEDALMLLYMALRNKRDTTASADEIHNNAGTVLLTATLSDDATTFTKGKYA